MSDPSRGVIRLSRGGTRLRLNKGGILCWRTGISPNRRSPASKICILNPTFNPPHIHLSWSICKTIRPRCAGQAPPPLQMPRSVRPAADPPGRRAAPPKIFKQRRRRARARAR